MFPGDIKLFVNAIVGEGLENQCGPKKCGETGAICAHRCLLTFLIIAWDLLPTNTYSRKDSLIYRSTKKGNS